MSIPKEIGQNIVYLRKIGNITQEWLALEVNMSVAYLRAIEHGRANPTVEMLSKIANALDVPFELLFERDLAEKYSALPSMCVYDETPLSLHEVAFLCSALHSFRNGKK